jgi:hypothetical protein
MNLIRDYLLNDFFKKFNRYFHVPRTWSQSRKAYYSWEDDHYCNFILLIVHALKPRYCDSGQLVISQENGVEEAIFVMKGKFQIGFFDFIRMPEGKDYYEPKLTYHWHEL